MTTNLRANRLRMKVPVRVIPQQAVIRKIIAVTDAHSVLVSTRSVLTAAIAAMKVDSAQKVSEWLISSTKVNIAKLEQIKAGN